MLVIGCGKLGAAFARTWRERSPGEALVCTVLREASRDRLPGFDVRVLDLLDPGATRQMVDGHERVLVSVVGRDAWATGVANLAAALPARAHVVHISSTGVYVEESGREVDEDAAVDAASPLVAAERALPPAQATVLRCAGLVGPDRGPHRVLDRVAGTERQDGWLNLVWMEDVVEAVAEAFVRGIRGTFNVSGCALSRAAFFDPLLARAALPSVRWTTGGGGRRVLTDRFAGAFATTLRPVDPGSLDPR